MLEWLKAVVRHLWEAPADVIALLAAIAGFCAAWYTRVQARASNTQVALSKKQLESEEGRTTKALEIAERGANAAELSAQVTKTLAEVGQRAWVSVNEIEVEKSRAASGDEDLFLVTTKLRNGGMSPALGFVADIRLDFCERPPGELDTPVLDETTAGVLGPNATFKLGPLLKGLKDSESRKIPNGHLVLYGLCSYRDIFNHTRHTRWCFRYVWKTGQFEPWVSEWNTME